MTALSPATLATIASTPVTLRALLGGLPVEAFEARDEGGWSALDVVAHLLDRRRAQRQRVEVMLAEERPLLPDEDERVTLEASGFRARPLGSLLIDFERQRREDVERYRALTAADLARVGMHSVAGEVTLGEMLNHVAYHDLAHLRQAAATLGAIAHEARGPMRRYE